MSVIVSLMGGLGFFLYGMKLMSEGLQKVAGSKMRSILEVFTKNRVIGLLVGIFFTALIQSSNATTVMVVSFVNSGLMKLAQAPGIILGANIGTTVTGQLIAFDLADIAPLFVIIGVLMVMFVKNNLTISRLGEVILGFGILFMGISGISGALNEAKEILAYELTKLVHSEEEAKKAAEEARKKAEEAMRILEEAKKAEEAALKAAEEARKKAEADAKKAAEEAAKAKAEEEKRKKAEEEAKKKAEAEAKKKAEEEAKKKAAEELAAKAEEEARKKAAEEAAKAEAEAKAKAEEARKILEAAKKAEEEALKAAEQADSIQIDLTQPAEEGKLPLAASYLEKYTKMEKSGKSLVDTFNAITVDQENRNVCMMGDHGFGLTSVGEDFARSFYDMGICKAKTIAKIKAQALNKVKLADAMSKLAGGCMVVENAGLIAPDKMTELMKLTAKDVNDVVVILTGATESINRLFGATGDAKDKFTHQINMEGISTQDMLAIAKGYFKQQGFKTDDSVEGTVKNLLMAMESGNIDRMLKACDEAMLKCDDREKAKGSSRKYLLSEDFK